MSTNGGRMDDVPEDLAVELATALPGLCAG